MRDEILGSAVTQESIRWILLLRGGEVCGSKSQLMASNGRHLLLETRERFLVLGWLSRPELISIDCCGPSKPGRPSSINRLHCALEASSSWGKGKKNGKKKLVSPPLSSACTLTMSYNIGNEHGSELGGFFSLDFAQFISIFHRRCTGAEYVRLPRGRVVRLICYRPSHFLIVLMFSS